LFNEELSRVLTVRERLIGNTDLYLTATLTDINQYITHVSARGSLNNSRLARVPIVWRELVSLRYHRFSNGFMSALKDLTI
jgi:hypothetical protein